MRIKAASAFSGSMEFGDRQDRAAGRAWFFGSGVFPAKGQMFSRRDFDATFTVRLIAVLLNAIYREITERQKDAAGFAYFLSHWFLILPEIWSVQPCTSARGL
jgi:hypothetical protein